jgi:cell division GTPase FtsZ
MEMNSKGREITKLKDSLTTIIQNNDDTIKVLKSKLDLANVYREAADIRADAVQSVAEKITKNTTVKVENKNSNEKQ